MKARLLNFFKNLIISFGLVVIVMTVFFTTSSCAVTFGETMRSTFSDWYRVIIRISFSVYMVGYLIIVLKLLANRTPERIKTLKESIGKFLITFFILSFLHYILIAIFVLNDQGITLAKKLGKFLSGLDMTNDEFNLYEMALSKAYEIEAVPGFIGLFVYCLLVFYTYKFVIIYVKRYINIIVLILIGPIILVVSTIKEILTGVNDGVKRKWFKEYIFNVIIQSLHAIYYAAFMGFAFKLPSNDENLIGVLLALVMLWFVFKLDGLIRKFFNKVGGSTTIRSSEKVSKALDTSGKVLDTAGDAALALSGKFGEKLDNFGNKAQEQGLGNMFKEGVANLKEGASEKFEQAKIKFKELPGNIKEGVKNLPQNIVDLNDKAWTAAIAGAQKGFNGAKALTIKGVKSGGEFAKKKYKQAKDKVSPIIKDRKAILSGKRIYVTPEEVAKQKQIMAEGKGFEKIRKGVNKAGYGVVEGAKKIGKYSATTVKNFYNSSKKGVKRKILEVQNEYHQIKNEIHQNCETLVLKKLPKLLRKHKGNIKYLEKNGQQIDMTNMMVLAVNLDSDVDIKEFLEELKEKYGDVSASAYTLEKLGVQTFLSPETGSPELGMTVLAEDIYEQIAEEQMEELIEGKEHKKRKLKKPSRRVSMKANKAASKEIKKNKGVNKVYKFSRFSPDTTRKILKRMNKNYVDGNTYLITLNKVYSNIDVFRPAGRVKTKMIELNHTMNFVRRDCVRKVTQLKLAKDMAVDNYKKFRQNSQQVGVINNIKDRAAIARKSIEISFGKIDKMTEGQVELKKMIEAGAQRRMFETTGNVTPQEKIRATGIVNNPQEQQKEQQNIVQYVVTQDGGLARQVVSSSGKIVEPAVTPNGEKVSFKQNVSKSDNSLETQSSEEKIVQHIVNSEGKIIKQVINENNEIETEEYKIVGQGGATLLKQLGDLTNGNIEIKVPEKTPKEVEAEKELDKIIAESARLAEVTSAQKLDFRDNVDLKETAIDVMVYSGLLTAVEAEQPETVQKALDILNSRVDEINNDITNTENFIERASEMDFTTSVEKTLNLGENTIYNVNPNSQAGDPNQVLLTDLLKNKIDEITAVPKEILANTERNYLEVMDNAAKGVKTPEQIAFDKQVEKIEKKWKKEQSKQEKNKKNKKSDEDGEELEKITLKFYGGVETQGESITLSNKYSIKDFYDKATKLDDVDLEKTQERFLQVYGEKLGKMQLLPFSFAKHPVKQMDGWGIYVVTKGEDVEVGEKTKKKVPEKIEKDLDKFYYEIKRIFIEFIKKYEIESFEEMYREIEELKILKKNISMLLFRKGEKDYEKRSEAIVNNLYLDIRFKNALTNTVSEIVAKKYTEEKMKKAKEAKANKAKSDKNTTNVNKNSLTEEKREMKQKVAEEVLGEAFDKMNQEIVYIDSEALRNQLEQVLYMQLGQGEEAKNNRKF